MLYSVRVLTLYFGHVQCVCVQLRDPFAVYLCMLGCGIVIMYRSRRLGRLHDMPFNHHHTAVAPMLCAAWLELLDRVELPHTSTWI